MKGTLSRGFLLSGSEQKLFKSPKMPLSKETKGNPQLYQVAGTHLLSPTPSLKQEQKFKLPPIKAAPQDLEEVSNEIQDNITWKNQKQDLQRCIRKGNGN